MSERDDMMGGPMPKPRDPLDTSDIPMADDLMRDVEARAKERSDSDVARMLDAVRVQLRQPNPTVQFDAVGRGLDFVDGTIARVNGLLAPRGWQVSPATLRMGWYVLRRAPVAATP